MRRKRRNKSVLRAARRRGLTAADIEALDLAARERVNAVLLWGGLLVAQIALFYGYAVAANLGLAPLPAEAPPSFWETFPAFVVPAMFLWFLGSALLWRSESRVRTWEDLAALVIAGAAALVTVV